jgi:hypothetical protein
MSASAFRMALVYFSAIGLGFMLVQIAVLQRFSIFLGHPTYTFSVTLFAMILFAGIGSYLSDVFRLSPRRERMLPIILAGTILALALGMQWTLDAAIRLALPMRVLVVVALLAPVSTLLGFFFPTGLRLVAALSPPATAWMWGVNGAFGVLGSIVAVGVSMWVGIQANLYSAAALYAFILLPLMVLQRAQSLPKV